MDHHDPEWLVEQMGPWRAFYFFRLANSDLSLVYSLHQHDEKLRDALRPELEAVEFAMRNRYHAAMQARRRGRSLWLLDEKLPAQRVMRGGVNERVYRDLSAKRMAPSHAVEALNFGFWTYLTDEKLELQMWKPYLKHVYPPRTTRTAVHMRATAVRELRNRVGHLGVVLDQPLRKLWSHMLWLLDRLNPELADERRRVSKLPDLLG